MVVKTIVTGACKPTNKTGRPTLYDLISTMGVSVIKKRDGNIAESQWLKVTGFWKKTILWDIDIIFVDILLWDIVVLIYIYIYRDIYNQYW